MASGAPLQGTLVGELQHNGTTVELPASVPSSVMAGKRDHGGGKGGGWAIGRGGDNFVFGKTKCQNESQCTPPDVCGLWGVCYDP